MKKIILLFVLFSCITCNNSTKQEYFYANGNIQERRIYYKKDTSTYSVTKYYLNGQISEKGFIKDGYKEGPFWRKFPNLCQKT